MLEKPFYLQDKFKKSTNTKTKISSLKYEVVNLYIEKNSQNINLGINCSPSREQHSSIYLWNVRMYFPRITMI